MNKGRSLLRAARYTPPAGQGSVRFARSDLIGTDVWRQHKKDEFAQTRAGEYVEHLPETVKVAVTGGAGAIGYSLLFRIASGEMFGKNQRVQIRAIELPFAMDALRGVAMELQDCAFPLLEGVFCTDDVARGFDDVDIALLVGSKPRGKGQERGDLIKENGEIFAPMGKALNKYARDCAKVVVVGNPANTNCLIAASNAPDIPRENFTAMTRLDHDRALAQLAGKGNCSVNDIQNFCIWGNHSPTMFPDVSNTTIKGKPALEFLAEQNQGEDMKKWYENDFIPTVQQRGAAIIAARGASSAASAANACLAHSRDWEKPNIQNWQSMAVPSEGNSYGVPDGLIFSFPVTIQDESYKIVDGIKFDNFAKQKIETTTKELLQERDFVSHLLPN